MGIYQRPCVTGGELPGSAKFPWDLHQATALHGTSGPSLQNGEVVQDDPGPPAAPEFHFTKKMCTGNTDPQQPCCADLLPPDDAETVLRARKPWEIVNYFVVWILGWSFFSDALFCKEKWFVDPLSVGVRLVCCGIQIR